MDDHTLFEPGPSDETLAALVALHDRAAVAIVYDRYARAIYALAVQMLGAADAEEVVQEVFLRLWHKAGQYDATRGSYRGWLFAIARHDVFDRLRQRQRQQRLTLGDDVERLLSEATDPAADVHEAVWGREQARTMLEALRSLPAEQRQVLVLAYFVGLTQTAIAEQLGWPLGTVKKRTQLGLQKLRSALGRKGMVMEARE
ncbi:MAG: RNA polymerase sigma factor [Dehalococcoidia bacterium]